MTASPQPGTDYIYTTAYYAKGSTWLPVTLNGNNAAPSYSSGPATGTLTASILQTLSAGTNYLVLWDWLWDAAAQCYKGPGLNQCNTGTWRVQTFNLAGSGLAPTVTAASPASGPTAGGTLITISGANFVSGATVLVGGTAATNVVFVNSTMLTAATPAHVAGLAGVWVTNPDGQTYGFTNSFTYADTGTSAYTQSAYTSGCTNCNNYYVATTGSDSNPGTQASPWMTGTPNLGHVVQRRLRLN